MRRYILAFFLALTSYSLDSIASAQTSGVASRGSSEPERMNPLGDEEVRHKIKTFSRCVYRREPEVVDLLLRYSDSFSIDYSGIGIEPADLNEELDLSECLVQTMRDSGSRFQLRISPQALRAHLAEEAYLANNDAPPVIEDGAPEIIPIRYVGPSSPQWTRAEAAFDDCIVYQAPQEAHNLLLTAPASESESVAVQRLMPALSGCLVLGEELGLTLQAVRNLAASGLWARSVLGPEIVAEAAE